jgi:ATP-dependent Clp protease adaptor protein ClpS
MIGLDDGAGEGRNVLEVSRGALKRTENTEPMTRGDDARAVITPVTMAGKEPPRRGNGRDNGNNGNDDEGRTGIVTKTRPKTKKPSLYKVLLLNDDYTPMEFVVLVLQRFFGKGNEEATKIMLHVHHKGVGICGVYTYEVAETKVTMVMDFSRQHGHPLQCTMEKE